MNNLGLVLTIADLLQDIEVRMPPAHGTFKQAQQVQQVGSEQLGGRLARAAPPQHCPLLGTLLPLRCAVQPRNAPSG